MELELSPPERSPGTRSRARAFVARHALVLVAFAVSRLCVVSASVYLHWARSPKGFFKPEFHRFYGVLGSWDGVWYERIARHGYLLVPGRFSNPAFFPFYPTLLRLGHLAGSGYTAAGLVLSNVCFLVAVFAVIELGQGYVGAERAEQAGLLLAVFPMGFVFSMVYPQSLVLASVVLALLAAHRRHWAWAALLAAVATLARPEGVFVALPLLAAASSGFRRAAGAERGARIVAVAAAPLALVAVALYFAWTLHDPLAWSRAEQAWGRSFAASGPLHAFTRFSAQLAVHPWLSRDLAFLLIYLATLVLAYRSGVPRAWLGFALLIILVPLGSGSVESIARLGLLAVPVYWGLGSLPPRAVKTVAVCSLGLLIGGTVTLPLAFP